MKKLSTKVSVFAVSISFALALLFFLRPPGNVNNSRTYFDGSVPDVWMDSGKLPGITWVDDIHPIFVRNKCGDCHTRGEEDIVEGLTEFALGIIDKKDPKNPFYSYHELVYNEAGPYKITGESLRDGQCCWPRGVDADQQRRIWLGHPERSTLMRKLDRDYYDWNEPPRFLGECLRLKWGPPMPLWQENDHATDDPEIAPVAHHGGDENGVTVLSISLFHRMLLQATLWLGGGQDKLLSLRPRISNEDLGMLRYWIANTLQIKDDRTTGLNIIVVDQNNMPVSGVTVDLIGNYNSPNQEVFKESFTVKTDNFGTAGLNFVPASVTSKHWYAMVQNGADKYSKKIVVEVGKIKTATIILSPVF